MVPRVTVSGALRAYARARPEHTDVDGSELAGANARGGPSEGSDTMAKQNDDRRKDDSGRPGGGAGRKDEVGGSGVYPMSGHNAPKDAEIRNPASWGQGERGAAGYEDSGGSELTMRDGQLLGGLTSGPDGRPEMDIHGDRRRSQQPVETERRRQQGSFGPGAGGERMSGRGGPGSPPTPPS